MKHELYVFGSATRGEIGATSDLDVLVIPTTAQEKRDFPHSWSFYKEKYLHRLHSEGRLFSWHLYLDAICVYSEREIPLVEEWGPPNEYSSAREDIDDLERLLSDSMSLLSVGTASVIYELGIVHTCLRDIAMSASWHLMDRPCFSQKAPYFLSIPLPVPVDVYEIIMLARHASTRGTSISNDLEVTRKSLLEAPLSAWIHSIKEKIP